MDRRFLLIIMGYFAAVVATSVFVTVWVFSTAILHNGPTLETLGVLFIATFIIIRPLITCTMIPAGLVIAHSESTAPRSRLYFWIAGAAIGCVVPLVRLVFIQDEFRNLYPIAGHLFPIGGLLFGPVAGHIYFKIAVQSANLAEASRQTVLAASAAFGLGPLLIVLATYVLTGQDGLKALFFTEVLY